MKDFSANVLHLKMSEMGKALQMWNAQSQTPSEFPYSSWKSPVYPQGYFCFLFAAVRRHGDLCVIRFCYCSRLYLLFAAINVHVEQLWAWQFR